MIHRFLVVAAALGLLLPNPAVAQTIEGPMTAISGDALLAPDGTTILRLFGIDAPELDTVEGWGAKMVLDGLVRGGVVQCTPVIGNQPRPAAAVQRTAAICSATQAGATADVALAMLQGGWATAQRPSLRGFSRESVYLDAERTAFEACSGFFAGKPWCPIVP